MSDLIAGAPMIKAHIRVTDLVQNIDPSAFDKGSNKAANVNLPAPDVATLFSSTDYSLAVFNHLGMDLGVSNYKIDPAFFATYPELYDHCACISGEGISLRPEAQARLTYPKPLDSQIFQTYRNFIEFSYGWPLRMGGVFG
jgi:threonine aldolase